MNRFLCVPLALALTLSLSAPAGAAEADASYSDTSGHWAEAAVGRWSAKGVIQGDHGAFRPDDPLSRQETAVLLARAFQVEDGQAPLPFSDKADVADWALGAVSALTAAGQLQGYSGAFDPEGDVTRASLVTMLDNMVSDLVTQAGDYSRDAESSLVVTADKAVLKDMEVKGDLIIADAVGDGDVTLENVRVDGRLIIRGGGEHSIHIAGDASRYGTVIVTKTASGKVRLVNESGAPIPMVNVADGRDGVTLEGDFTGVVVASDVAVVAASGSIESLTVAVENAQVTLGGDAKVKKLDVPKDAAGATLTVERGASVSTLTLGGAATVQNSGTIEKAEVAAGDVVLGGQKPSTVFVEKDVEQPKDDSGNTVTDNTSSKNDGGGSDDSGGSYVPSTTTLSAVTANLASPQAAKAATAATPNGTGYTVATSWAPVPEDEIFAKDTTYTATLTFTPAAYHQWSTDILEHVAVNNSTSYGGAATLGTPALDGGKVTVTAEFPATAAVLEIVVDSQPVPSITVQAGAFGPTVQVAAHVTADDVTVANYPITYVWMDDQGQPVQNGEETIFHLPANLSEGIHTFHCRMTADGCEPVDSDDVEVTVKAAARGLVISNAHFDLEDRELRLRWELQDENEVPLNASDYRCEIKYYASGTEISSNAWFGFPSIDFDFGSYDFSASPVVIDRIEITPPSGDTYIMNCTLTLNQQPFPGSAAAVYDSTANTLTLSGYSSNGIGDYIFQFKDSLGAYFMKTGNTRLNSEDSLIVENLNSYEQELLQAPGNEVRLYETRASVTDGTTAALNSYQSDWIELTLQQSGNE